MKRKSIVRNSSLQVFGGKKITGNSYFFHMPKYCNYTGPNMSIKFLFAYPAGK